VVRAGVRGAFEHPLSGPFSLRLHADALGTLTPGTIYLNAASAWTTNPIVLGIGLGIQARFP
jgi:hypothetical protein